MTECTDHESQISGPFLYGSRALILLVRVNLLQVQKINEVTYFKRFFFLLVYTWQYPELVEMYLKTSLRLG